MAPFCPEDACGSALDPDDERHAFCDARPRDPEHGNRHHRGSPLLVTNATVTLTRTANAVTSAVAEINPQAVTAGSAGNTFVCDILPTINPGDSGVNSVAITAPAGYTNLSLTNLSAGGLAQSLNCPAPGAGQYCATTAGQVMTVALGTKIITSLIDIRVTFTADAPGALGSAAFAAVLGGSLPKLAVAGDANGNAADANSMTVTVQNPSSADPNRSTVTASPPIVNADGVALSTITVSLRDVNNLPVPTKTVILSSSRGAGDTLTQPAAVTDANGVATGSIRSLTIGTSSITATDVTDGVVLTMQPQVTFTRDRCSTCTRARTKKRPSWAMWSLM